SPGRCKSRGCASGLLEEDALLGAPLGWRAEDPEDAAVDLGRRSSVQGRDLEGRVETGHGHARKVLLDESDVDVRGCVERSAPSGAGDEQAESRRRTRAAAPEAAQMAFQIGPSAPSIAYREGNLGSRRKLVPYEHASLAWVDAN